MDQVVGLLHDQAEVYQDLLEVIHLLKPPTSLFRPKILKKVIAQHIRRVSGPDLDPVRFPLTTAQ